MSFFFADNNFSSVNIKLSESLLNIREIIRLIGLEIKIRPYLINNFYPWYPINIFLVLSNVEKLLLHIIEHLSTVRKK